MLVMVFLAMDRRKQAIFCDDLHMPARWEGEGSPPYVLLKIEPKRDDGWFTSSNVGRSAPLTAPGSAMEESLAPASVAVYSRIHHDKSSSIKISS
jgi:hypothetical protein